MKLVNKNKNKNNKTRLDGKDEKTRNEMKKITKIKRNPCKKEMRSEKNWLVYKQECKTIKFKLKDLKDWKKQLTSQPQTVKTKAEKAFEGTTDD